MVRSFPDLAVAGVTRGARVPAVVQALLNTTASGMMYTEDSFRPWNLHTDQAASLRHLLLRVQQQLHCSSRESIDRACVASPSGAGAGLRQAVWLADSADEQPVRKVRVSGTATLPQSKAFSSSKM